MTNTERIKRLEQLVAKVLMTAAKAGPGLDPLLNRKPLPTVPRIALYERFHKDIDTIQTEDRYALDAVVNICADTIATKQQQYNEVARIEQEHEAASKSLASANKQAAEAQAILDKLC